MSDAAEQPALEELTKFLLRPDAYPAECFPGTGPRQVDLVETHISRLFLTEQFVYKLKKPVRFEFLDFSTLALRRDACRDEVRLNRRLAPNVYLGVVPIRRTTGGEFVLGAACDPDDPELERATGDTIDWIVAMRRLDRARMLDHLIDAGTLNDGQVRELSDTLAGFYANRPPLKISADEYLAAVLHHVRANRVDLLATAPAAEQHRIRKLHAAQLTLLLRHRDLFEARVAAGRIIDGHGDLRPEHICLESPPVVYDCVEFSAEFRRIDVADELSFLEMECAKLGRRDVGQAVVEAYVRASGDRPPPELRAFYESYRACVRAKVAALRLKQQSPESANTTAVELRRDLEIAEAAVARFHRPTLYVMRGLMGTGKSTLAAAMAEALGIEQLRTDALRRELFGASDRPQAFNAGTYQPAQKRQVYKELLRRARQSLLGGLDIIADGAFLEADSLALARDTASAADAELLVVECRCPAEVAKQRIVARLAEGRDPSEARPELYDRQAAAACALPHDLPAVTVDAARPVEEQLISVFRHAPAQAS